MSLAILGRAGDGAPVLDTARPAAQASQADLLRAMAQQMGGKPSALVGGWMRLSRGPGKISFNDFVRLRLFDRDFHGGARLEEYVGQLRNMSLCVQANHRREWFGILRNKVAARAYLADHGLPTIPISAIYAPRLASAGGLALTSPEALARFLTTPSNFPLFAKPAEGLQSLGAIGLKGVDPKARVLEGLDGAAIPLDALVREIHETYAAGYVFQPLVAPHAEIARLCGPRLATVRLLTILGPDGPKVLRAAMKVPSGANFADNYWRAGNMLARVDLETGLVGAAISGMGLSVAEHACHPDSGRPIEGFQHPDWPRMTALALEGASLMRHVPLIGWDIACTKDGPLIVEMNETPDFALVQLSERRGMLDAEFSAFLAFQKAEAAREEKEGVAVAMAQLI